MNLGIDEMRDHMNSHENNDVIFDRRNLISDYAL
jgi:hypothetical protein